MFEVYLTKNADKSLNSLDEDIKERIKDALIKLKSFPDELD